MLRRNPDAVALILLVVLLVGTGWQTRALSVPELGNLRPRILSPRVVMPKFRRIVSSSIRVPHLTRPSVWFRSVPPKHKPPQRQQSL